MVSAFWRNRLQKSGSLRLNSSKKTSYFNKLNRFYGPDYQNITNFDALNWGVNFIGIYESEGPKDSKVNKVSAVVERLKHTNQGFRAFSAASRSSIILSLTIFMMEKPMVDITATIKIYSTECLT